MPRIADSAPVNTQGGRRRLAPKDTPYWRGIRAGLRLGWLRKGGAPAGTWLVRVAWPKNKTTQKALATADDGVLVADGEKVFSYDQAVTAAIAFAQALERGTAPAAPGRGAPNDSVRDGLTAYQDAKDAAGQATQAAEVATLIEGHLPADLAARRRRALTKADLRSWVGGLRRIGGGEALSQDRVDGLRTIMRAALRLAGDVSAEAITGLGDAAVIEARGPRQESADNNIELTREQRRRLIATSPDVAGVDFGLLVATLDVTGLRPGQLARCAVSALDMEGAGAILNAPRSMKGRPGVRKRGLCSAPLPEALAARLVARVRTLGLGRQDLLFTRARMMQVPGQVGVWEEDGRAAWDKTSWGRAFDAVAEAMAAAGEPLDANATLYSLRHTRICTWIAHGLSVTEIAQRVDTSARMIERHYARQIARRDYAQERLRRIQEEERDIYGG